MQVRFLPEAPLRLCAVQGLCEAGLLAGCRVFLDNAPLCSLIDGLVGLGEGDVLHVCADLLAGILRSSGKHALAAQVKHALIKGGAVGFLRRFRNCHGEQILRYFAITRKWYDTGMIRELAGTIIGTEPGGVVVEVAGFGVFVHMAGNAPAVGETVRLKTCMAFKQDGVELYGFLNEEDRRFFEQVCTVSGIGPKTALSILARSTREALETALAGRDISYLTRVVGLSKKTAEKMAVELSEKVSGSEEKRDGVDAEVFDTLVALGYTDREARAALSKVPMHITGRDARLKAALAN